MTEQQHGLVDQLLQYYFQYSHQGLMKSSHLYDVHYNIPHDCDVKPIKAFWCHLPS